MIGTGRLETFSDGVLAIIITIMVLEMKAPHGTDIASLKPIIPVFLSYILSFAYLAIYWNNHHHLMHITKKVSGGVLWANLHLLFWLSLIPFVTAWMGETSFEPVPVALYGVALLMAAIAYGILVRAITISEGANSLVREAVGRDVKGIGSGILYALAIPATFVSPWIAGAIYVGVALIWLVPDRRVERVLANLESGDQAAG